ncbi:S-layer homology domain-containing protein [Jeotgalibacillus salarius]|uniref:S-layer homology domain-containing protein n=1 Tax=Jeotgalibacillus salarius TaxID=546023 RepID=A0A4Y8LLW3_9BACL|nr:S-layer homology domain-containing protein [Jeotgalibacillus salarius]TFE04032.1 S-layer homology domain-containing protein [Jeotgalibacillus salarius]
MKKIISASLLSAGVIAILPAQASAFNDVSMYEKEIQYLSEAGVIKGFEDGQFKPASSLNRLQAIQMILREMDVTDFSAADPDFTDVNAGDYGYEEIAKAVDLGIISGKTDIDGNSYFDPYGPLTRGQMAKILSEAYELDQEWRYFFNDVSHEHWAKDYIDRIASDVITTGYEDQTFRPENDIERQHFALFMARMLNDDFITGTELQNISFMMDQDKEYVFEEILEDETITYTLSFAGHTHVKDNDWEVWAQKFEGGDHKDLLYVEADNRLYSGWLGSEYFPRLDYPIYDGKEWSYTYGSESTHQILDTDATITTRAGTFEHVVVQEDLVSNQIQYYAPNVGLIKSEFGEERDDLNISTELVEVREASDVIADNPVQTELNPTEFETIEEIDGKAVIGELKDPGVVPAPSIDTVEVTIIVEEYFGDYESMNDTGLLFIKNNEPRKGVWIGLKHPEENLEALTTYLQKKVDAGEIPFDSVHIYYTPFTQDDLRERTRLVSDEVQKIASQHEGAGSIVSTDYNNGEIIVEHNFLNEVDQKKLQSSFPQYSIRFERIGTQIPDDDSQRIVWPDSLVTNDLTLNGHYIIKVEEDSFLTAQAGAIAGEHFDAVNWSFTGASEHLEIGQRVKVEDSGFVFTSYPEQATAVIVNILPTYLPQSADKTEAQVVRELIQKESFSDFAIKTISDIAFNEPADEWTITVVNSMDDAVVEMVIAD